MTFDDGIVKIYDVINSAEPGELPVDKLQNPIPYHFHEETVGVTRYYEAIKANQLIERVITTYLAPINTNHENGIKITRLSLERNGENYEIAG